MASNRVLQYRVESPQQLFRGLESLAYALSTESNVVLLPFGPKIFTLCASLVGLTNDSVAIWRVSAEEHEVPVDRKAAGYIGGLQVQFGPTKTP